MQIPRARTAFIITIDTEGDDLWSRPREISTRNARYLPRFQALCDRFNFKPVYLANHEMAACDAFVEFARDVVHHGTAEIGMHLHAWNSPPLEPLTADDFRHQPYLIEYPPALMRQKIRAVTHLLEDRIGRKMVSHRAGRWAFDSRYAELLLAEGYRVDCSVTPGVDWSTNSGAPGGKGGSDYTDFPDQPYFLDANDPSRAAAAGLLEVPMTIRPSALYRRAAWTYQVPLLRRAANRLAPGLGWLCPVQAAIRAPVERHLAAMLEIGREACSAGLSHLEFMLHSSELMPGGSPTFRRASDIELLYEHLEMLFEEVAVHCRGMTLEEFHRAHAPPQEEVLCA